MHRTYFLFPQLPSPSDLLLILTAHIQLCYIYLNCIQLNYIFTGFYLKLMRQIPYSMNTLHRVCSAVCDSCFMCLIFLGILSPVIDHLCQLCFKPLSLEYLRQGNEPHSLQCIRGSDIPLALLPLALLYFSLVMCTAASPSFPFSYCRILLAVRP